MCSYFFHHFPIGFPPFSMVFHNFSLCVHHLFFHCFPPCSPMFPYMSITFSIVFHHVSLSFPICPSFFPWFSTMFPYVSLYFHHFFHGFPPCFAIFPLFPMGFPRCPRRAKRPAPGAAASRAPRRSSPCRSAPWCTPRGGFVAWRY